MRVKLLPSTQPLSPPIFPHPPPLPLSSSTQPPSSPTSSPRSIAGVMRNSGCEIPDHLLILTEKRKEIGRMNRQRISRKREERKNKRNAS